MKRFIYMLAAFALMGAVSCQPDEEVAVHASFTTDKESYDVGDPVVLTNTSTAENALIAICKWELGKGVVSYETTPENISYDQAGEYVIKLTVTSDRGAKKSSFEKTIRVVDNNIRPVADFTWSPEKVVAGEPVQFTDRSTDEDGTVYAATQKTGSVAAHVTAISAQGVKRWEHAADGDINGVPAVDDQGFVYYNDRTTGKLVKLRPEDGSRVAEIKLADELRSSPTISYDGTIYVNGMKDDKPTVFAVKGAAEGCAASWSQQGGNPSKTEYMY